MMLKLTALSTSPNSDYDIYLQIEAIILQVILECLTNNFAISTALKEIKIFFSYWPCVRRFVQCIVHVSYGSFKIYMLGHDNQHIALEKLRVVRLSDFVIIHLEQHRQCYLYGGSVNLRGPRSYK